MVETIATRYVHLSPTVLLPVPDCYSSQKPDVDSERCWLCSVKRECEQGMPTETRMRPIWSEVKQ